MDLGQVCEGSRGIRGGPWVAVKGQRALMSDKLMLQKFWLVG